MQAKYNEDIDCNETEPNPQKQRIALLEKNNLDQEKHDMWED